MASRFSQTIRNILDRLRRDPKSDDPAHQVEAVLDGYQAIAAIQASNAEITQSSLWQTDSLRNSVPEHAFIDPEKSASPLGAERLDSTDAREAFTTGLGLSLSGIRASVNLDGAGFAAVQDLLEQAVNMHAPVVTHVAFRSMPESGLTQGDGHRAYHFAQGSGCLLFFARNVQEVVDLTLLAHHIAERALLPAVVAFDQRETGLAIQNVMLPSFDLMADYLGDPAQLISSPTTAQQLLFKDERRKIPRWHDLDNSALLHGAGQGQWGPAAAGQQPYFIDPLPALLETATHRLTEMTGRPQAPLVIDGAADAELIVVAQGAGSEAALFAANQLRDTRIGVVGVRQLNPFPAAKLLQSIRGKRVLVLERASAAMLDELPLQKEIQRAIAKALENGSGSDPSRHVGYPSWRSKDMPVAVTSHLYGLGSSALPAADLVELCHKAVSGDSLPRYLGITYLPEASQFPHRQATLDQLKRKFPAIDTLGQQTSRNSVSLDEQIVSIGLLGGAETLYQPLGQLLHRINGGIVRSRPPGDAEHYGVKQPSRVWQSPAFVGDPGDDAPYHVALATLATLSHPAFAAMRLVAGGALIIDSPLDDPSINRRLPPAIRKRLADESLAVWISSCPSDQAEAAPLRQERLLGSVMTCLNHQQKVQTNLRRLRTARKQVCETLGIDFGDTLAEALKSGFEGLKRLTPVEDATPDHPGQQSDIPFVVKSLEQTDGASVAPVNQLDRFWNEVGVVADAGSWSELSIDPMLASHVTPPLSAAFRRMAPLATQLPAWDPALCTGCGKCWTFCPDGAIGASALHLEGLFKAAMKATEKQGSDVSALQMLVPKLAATVQKTLLQEQPSPKTVADLFAEPFAQLMAKASFPADRLQTLTNAFDAVISTIGKLPVANTMPLFGKPEAAQNKTGSLLSLAINPDACKSCGICAAVCEPEAMRLEPATQEHTVSTKQGWSTWQTLPDTSGETIARAADEPEVGRLPAMLLSRHALFSMVNGDGAEAGSGAKIALRLTLAIGEYERQRATTAQLNEIDQLRNQLAEQIRENLAAGLPTADIDALASGIASLDQGAAKLSELAGRLESGANSGRIDAVRLQRITDVARQLADLSWRLRKGNQGLGRARLGLVLVPDLLTHGIGTFPYNPFQVPTIVHSGREAAALARGLIAGQIKQTLGGAAALRQASLELESPNEAALARARRPKLDYVDLQDDEKRACPPLLLVGGATAFDDRSLATLLSSDLPIKVLIFADGAEDLVRPKGQSLRDELGLLALNFHRAFVGQTTIGDPEHFFATVSAAFRHLGPAVLRVHAPSPGVHGFRRDGAIQRSIDAVASRTFPLFTFDPQASGVFGSRLSLAGNPAPADPWVSTDSGQPMTPADWAMTDDRFASHFTLADKSKTGTPVADYIQLPDHQRGGRLPIVLRNVGTERQSLVCSPEMISLSKSRAAVWRTLQELSGVVTPFTERVKEEAKQLLASEHQDQLAKLRQEYEQRIADLNHNYTVEIAERVKEGLMQLAGFEPTNDPVEEEQA